MRKKASLIDVLGSKSLASRFDEIEFREMSEEGALLR